MSASLLTVENLSLATPDGRPLGAPVSFSLAAGSIVSLEGPNGSGKTTCLRVLVGIASPSGGRIEWRVGRDDLAYLPQLQSYDLHLPYTLEDVIRSGVPRWLPPEALASPLLSREKLGLRWATASGGERKRALLLRALLQGKRVLLLDEPLNHLDRESRALVARALETFLDTPGRGILLVSHEGEAAGLRAIPRTVVRLGSAGEADG